MPGKPDAGEPFLLLPTRGHGALCVAFRHMTTRGILSGLTDMNLWWK